MGLLRAKTLLKKEKFCAEAAALSSEITELTGAEKLMDMATNGVDPGAFAEPFRRPIASDEAIGALELRDVERLPFRDPPDDSWPKPDYDPNQYAHELNNCVVTICMCS